MARDRSIESAIAVTRFGLGARPGDIDRVGSDPRGWLTSQIDPSGAPSPVGQFPSGRSQLGALGDYRRETARMRQAMPAEGEAPSQPMTGTAMAPMQAEDNPLAARQAARRELRQDVGEEFLARLNFGIETPQGFAERWVLFWANWFTVSAAELRTSLLVGPFEREAIRPNVFGRFEDLLLAAERHPAMLLYLDQAQSVGPNSPGGRRRGTGLNENLGREILELHTLGAEGGYTQADVTELARALTGWSAWNGRSTAQAEGRDPTGYEFRRVIHEPGPRTVLGRTYADSGEAQAADILKALAAHPATARHAARRIAVHFVADQPPPSLIAALERAWTSSGGDLARVARALIEAPEAWAPEAAKLKTPYEFIVSGYRAAGRSPTAPQQVAPVLVGLGQPAWAPPSPEGWAEDAPSWAAPDSLVKRLNWSQAFADRAAPEIAPVELADAVLGPRLGTRSRTAISRAEDRAEAFAILLMSPEFQRR